jgi:hypothetical protein
MTQHGPPKGAIVLRKPDGSAFSKAEVIVLRRRAFRWLPVYCSNDLAHGSWWMVWGSILSSVFAIIPLIQKYYTFYTQQDDILPTSDFDLTWGLLIFSGVALGIGSFAFVRAFDEPPRKAMFYWFKHCQSDELVGAWFFFLGTLPAIPYTLVFFVIIPSATTFAGVVASVIFTIGCLFFVTACYPSEGEGNKYMNRLQPLCTWLTSSYYVGPRLRIWVVTHLATDWLAGTWFFLWANLLFTIGAFALLGDALLFGTSEQIFMALSAASVSFLFLIGSFYFVAGSYPQAQSFFYEINDGGRRRTGSITAPPGDYTKKKVPKLNNDIENDHNDDSDDEATSTHKTPKAEAMEPRKIETLNPLHDEENTTPKATKTTKEPKSSTSTPASSTKKNKIDKEEKKRQELINSRVEAFNLVSLSDDEEEDTHPDDDDDDDDHHQSSSPRGAYFSPLQQPTRSKDKKSKK